MATTKIHDNTTEQSIYLQICLNEYRHCEGSDISIHTTDETYQVSHKLMQLPFGIYHRSTWCQNDWLDIDIAEMPQDVAAFFLC